MSPAPSDSNPIIPPPPTTTTTTLPKTGDLNIISANFDADGYDNANPNGEWVDIRNDDTVTVDMTGWRLEDEGPNFTYDFPDGFTLAPGVTVRVRVGVGTDTATTLYWGLGSAVWNNSGDTASLAGHLGAVRHLRQQVSHLGPPTLNDHHLNPILGERER